MNTWAKLTLPALLLVGLSGCPAINAVSTAPPTRTAAYDRGEDKITLSRGVAMAIDCYDAFNGGPCENGKASTDDPNVARVLPAHLDKELHQRYPFHDSRTVVDQAYGQKTVFVIGGVSPGRTKLRISSDEGDQEFDVEVIEEADDRRTK